MTFETIKARAEAGGVLATTVVLDRTDIDLLVAVAEASSRFRHFADQINAYIANPTAGQDAAKGAWLEGLHAAQADVDAALDALEAAP